MNIEPRLLVSDIDKYDKRYVSLNCIVFNITNNLISSCTDNTGDIFDYLISTNNEKFKIKDLKCKTYEEMLITLEIHGLLHGLNENLDDKSTLDKCKNLLIENTKLKEENEKLNKKFLKLKKLFNN